MPYISEDRYYELLNDEMRASSLSEEVDGLLQRVEKLADALQGLLPHARARAVMMEASSEEDKNLREEVWEATHRAEKELYDN